MGPSGAGKTTLMNILSSILRERPESRSVASGGQEITRLSENELSDFRRKEIALFFKILITRHVYCPKTTHYLPLAIDRLSVT